MGRIILGIVGIVVILILGGSVLPDVVDDTASDSYSEPFSVVTGVGETSTIETLSYASYYDDLTDLVATSDNGSDTPVVMNYTEATYTVGVTGLAASDSRILTIAYTREAGEQFFGFGPFMRLLPFLVIVGGIIACIFAIYSGIKQRG